MRLDIESIKIIWQQSGALGPKRQSFLASCSKDNAPKSHDEYGESSVEVRALSAAEICEGFDRVREALNSQMISKSGPHRIDQWVSGWSETLEVVSQSEAPTSSDLVPRYFRKGATERLNNSWVSPLDQSMELLFLKFTVDSTIERLLANFNKSSVYEFGCGTGQHLIRLLEIGIADKVVGLDWAKSSQEILTVMQDRFAPGRLSAKNFDYFKPDAQVLIPSDALVLTVASLEQIGEDFLDFVAFLVGQPGTVVANFEPIAELLPDDLLGTVSKEYFRKRNYLHEYMKHLEALEGKGMIKIHAAERTFFGSFFIEGYSLIIWEVL